MNEDYKCLGCGRNELHKHCPAYGTEFYCSGINYTEEIERLITKLQTSGFSDAEKTIFVIMKTLQVLEKQNESNIY